MAELIQWPEVAKVDRLIPKERLYAETSASLALKQRFVDEVQRVRWAYNLSEDSLHFAPGQTVTEIQVFLIDLKGPDLDNSILASIDRAIPSQVIFELRRNNGPATEQAMTAAYKHSGVKTKGSDYFRTAWIGSEQPRAPLPVTLDLDSLYSQILGRLLPYQMWTGEELWDTINRVGRIRRLAREIPMLEKRVRAEAQFNYKVELRIQLRIKQAALAGLTRNEDGMTEDAAWRS
ncbi:DUF4391 domain-containing protein [Ferrimicrobium sp.]|uniref:DUF4391 domain-containing protein n=1 Tax=Ferrimicrobium sp. TaxID=2926050 RepID=UPI0026047784|nr:DUF4391 domain-containing protein [Ferrimicrobium sp.]